MTTPLPVVRTAEDGLQAHLDDHAALHAAYNAQLDAEPPPAAAAAKVSLQGIIAGELEVGDNVLPPGLRVPVEGYVTAVNLLLGTVYVGGNLIIDVIGYDPNTAQGYLIRRVPVAQNWPLAQEGPTGVGVFPGHYVRFNVVQIGSDPDLAAADCNIEVEITPGTVEQVVVDG